MMPAGMCLSDEMFMLVTSSAVFQNIERSTFEWHEAFVQAVVTPSSGIMVVAFFVVLLPVLGLLMYAFLHFDASRKKMPEPESWQISKAPSASSSMRWLDIRSKSSAQGSTTHENRPPPFLCSEMVVPSGLECEFALPNLQGAFEEEFFNTSQECLSLPKDIRDRTGRPLLRVALSRIAGETRSSFFEYVLLAKQDATELASCELHMTSDGSRKRTRCSIFVKTGEVFASVEEENDPTREQRSFTVTGTHQDNPWQLRVFGDFEEHCVEVINVETGRRVAGMLESEPILGGEHRIVRCASSADAALVIIALVIIDRIVALVPRTRGQSTATSLRDPAHEWVVG